MPPPSRLLKPGTDDFVETGHHHKGLVAVKSSSSSSLFSPTIDTTSCSDTSNFLPSAAVTAVAAASAATESASSSSSSSSSPPFFENKNGNPPHLFGSIVETTSSSSMVSPTPRKLPPACSNRIHPHHHSSMMDNAATTTSDTTATTKMAHHPYHHQVTQTQNSDSSSVSSSTVVLTDQSSQQYHCEEEGQPNDAAAASSHFFQPPEQLQQQQQQQQQLAHHEDVPSSPPLQERKRRRRGTMDPQQQQQQQQQQHVSHASSSSSPPAGAVLEASFEKTRLRDIVGHGSAKLRIDEILLPLALPRSIAESVLTGLRSQPCSILLYGPPGCGKTQLARAIAGEAQAAFLIISPSDILSKFVGESEAAVRCIFKRAQEYASQLESKCAVIFFDEIDALGQSRENRGSGEGEGCSRRVLAELLIQLNAIADRSKQGQKHHHHQDLSSTDDEYVPEDRSIESRTLVDVQDPQVLIVAATNRAEDCDPALLRRFGVRLEVGLPTKKDRTKMLSRHLSKFAHVITDAELNNLAEATNGWSGSDLESLTREAAMAPVRECLRAAALQRRRQRHAQGRQTEGDMSGPEDGGLDGGDQEVRSSLLASFQALRPVTMSDFECAANFWLGNQQQQASPAHANGKVFGSVSKVHRQAHYDSSSDEDD